MVSRPPHTIPYSSGRLQYEEKATKLAMIQKDVPLTQSIIKFIIGEETFGDKLSDEVSEDGDYTDRYTDAIQTDVEEAPLEIQKNTWTDRRPTAGRPDRLTQMLNIDANEENIDEAREDLMQYQAKHIEVLSDEFSSDETVEVRVEKPFYDIEGRGRELREQERENEQYLQEINNNLDFLESKYMDLKSVMDKDIRRFLIDLRQFDDDDLEDIQEDIEAILEEEEITSVEFEEVEEE